MKRRLAVILSGILISGLLLSSCSHGSNLTSYTNTGFGSNTSTSAPSLANAISCVVYIVSKYGKWQASGSGFIIDKDGYVITNNHVVEQGFSASLTLADGRTITADIVYRDTITDIAILKCPSGVYPTTVLGSISSPNLGDDVMAIGYPSASVLGDSASISKGIVSAFRTIDGIKYVQTDASLNPGSSGGPLINSKGEVIGICTLKITQTEGLNFAIDAAPIKASVEDVIRQLKTGKTFLPKAPAQIAQIPTSGVIFEYHGRGTTPLFNLPNNIPWKLVFRPDFDDQASVWAASPADVAEWGNIPYGLGPLSNAIFSSEVTAGRLYSSIIYEPTGSSLSLGLAQDLGPYSIWIVSESYSVSSIPFTYTGEGSTNTTLVWMEQFKQYKLTYSKSWDGGLTTHLIGLNRSGGLTFLNLGTLPGTTAGVLGELIFVWNFPSQAAYFEVAVAPPIGNWTISIS